MPEATVKRTLVKSPPELWAEISDVTSLARHLGEFGEIRITRTDPETTVAWEGDRVRGTVELEASGWGTRVTLTARTTGAAPDATVEDAAAASEPEVDAAVGPDVVVEPEPESVAIEPAVEPEPIVEPEPVVAPEAIASEAIVEPEREPEPVADHEPEVAQTTPPKPGFFARLFGRKPKAPVADTAPAPAPEPTPAPERPALVPVVTPAEPEPVITPDLPPAAAAQPVVTPDVPLAEAAVEDVPAAVEEPEAPAAAEAPAFDDQRAEEILTAVLDDLGSAHHRPFSR